jgi:ribosomal protein S18 acetylase RimI-like enzyme
MRTLTQHATLDDVPSLASLFNQYRQFYGQSPALSLAQDFIGERIRQKDSALLVARNIGGELTGFCQLYPLLSSIRCRRTLLLNDLFVLESARGCGVGRTLLTAARSHANASGVATLTLDTGLDNLSAQRLYESFGFTRSTGFCTYVMDLQCTFSGRVNPS